MSGQGHSLDDDFEHFLAYTGYGLLYEGQPAVLAHLRKAYEDGNQRGAGAAEEAPDQTVIDQMLKDELP